MSLSSVNMTSASSSSSSIEILQARVDEMESLLDLTISALDTFFLLSGTILVLCMQPGFALLEVGGASVKHTKNILIKNILDFCCSFMAWWAFGAGLALSSQGNSFTGTSSFLMKGNAYQDKQGYYGPDEGYNYAMFFFQMAFCRTAGTIVSGAAAERITLTAYFLLNIIMATYVFPLVWRWCWSTAGWASAFNEDPLWGCGVIDFAGSGVVHSCGGMAALVTSIMLRPRLNRFTEDGRPREMPKQSSMLTVLGSFLLFVGWFGFNGMSTLVVVGKADVAAKVMVVTALASTAAALTTAVLGYLLLGRTSPDEICNGWLAGLVAITAPCAVVEPEAGIVIGMLAAPIYLYSSDLLLDYHIDDSVGASPVHLVNGVWGMIAAGLFATKENYASSYYSDRAGDCCGFLYGCGTTQLFINIIVVTVIIVWTGINTYLVLKLMSYLSLLRVSAKAEKAGLDTATHGGEEVGEQLMELLSLKSDLVQLQQMLHAERRDTPPSSREQQRPISRMSNPHKAATGPRLSMSSTTPLINKKSGGAPAGGISISGSGAGSASGGPYSPSPSKNNSDRRSIVSTFSGGVRAVVGPQQSGGSKGGGGGGGGGGSSTGKGAPSRGRNSGGGEQGEDSSSRVSASGRSSSLPPPLVRQATH